MDTSVIHLTIVMLPCYYDRLPFIYNDPPDIGGIFFHIIREKNDGERGKIPTVKFCRTTIANMSHIIGFANSLIVK